MSEEKSKLQSNSTAGIDENSDEVLDKSESEDTIEEEKKPKTNQENLYIYQITVTARVLTEK